MAKIFIDPGHGAHDPGAVGKNSKEKDNVLKVGLRLKTLLESAGHIVKMSHSTDVFIGLSERARMANNWGADYFVSLHNNSATSNASGFETFIFNGPVSAATFKLQSDIHKAIANKIGIRDRGLKRGNLAVLRESNMPAVLIEYAFVSNTDDESILINKVEQLAQWTAEGIISYAGGSLKPTPQPQKEEDDEMDQLLPNTQKEDMKNLLQCAFDEKVFSDNHSSKVDTMTRGQATDLLISYVARKK